MALGSKMFKVTVSPDKRKVSVAIDSVFVVPGKPSMVEPEELLTEKTVWLRLKHSFNAEFYSKFPQAVEDVISLAIVQQNQHVSDGDAMRVAHSMASRINVELEKMSN